MSDSSSDWPTDTIPVVPPADAAEAGHQQPSQPGGPTEPSQAGGSAQPGGSSQAGGSSRPACDRGRAAAQGAGRPARSRADRAGAAGRPGPAAAPRTCWPTPRCRASTTRRWTATRSGRRTLRLATEAGAGLAAGGRRHPGRARSRRARSARGLCLRIMTGAPMPPGADAVVPVEWTDGGVARVRITARPTGAYVRRAGEDIRAGELALAPAARRWARAGRRCWPPSAGSGCWCGRGRGWWCSRPAASWSTWAGGPGSARSSTPTATRWPPRPATPAPRSTGPGIVPDDHARLLDVLEGAVARGPTSSSPAAG